MDTEEMRKQSKVVYDGMVNSIEAAQMYDGRGKGVDVYVCNECGAVYYTRYKDKGVTPFTIHCRKCKMGTMVHKNTLTEQFGEIIGMTHEIHNWVRPSFEQFLILNEGAKQHVLQGGLLLDEELEALDEKKVDIKDVFNKIQGLLDSLQDTGATFMFMTGEGRFVISGDPTSIMAELTIAMVRYPIVKEMIDTCSKKFDEIKAECGEDIENINMTHLIEKYK